MGCDSPRSAGCCAEGVEFRIPRCVDSRSRNWASVAPQRPCRWSIAPRPGSPARYRLDDAVSRPTRGRRRRLRAWIFTAVRSRHRFVYPVRRDHGAASKRARRPGFRGGVRVLISDNTKAVFGTTDPLEPDSIAVFLEYSQDRGRFVIPPACATRATKAMLHTAPHPLSVVILALAAVWRVPFP